MQNISELMSSYQRYHTKAITQATHFIGVPCIVFSIQVALGWFLISFHSISISFAWIAVIILAIYYFLLDIVIGSVTVFFLILLTYFAQCITHHHFSSMGLMIFLSTFIVGWVAQFMGHCFEGNRPAFTDNILQVFVAPVFLVTELLLALRLKKSL